VYKIKLAIKNMAESEQRLQEPNEDALAAEKARRGVKDDSEEESRHVAMYLEDNFKQYVKEKYAV